MNEYRNQLPAAAVIRVAVAIVSFVLVVPLNTSFYFCFFVEKKVQNQATLRHAAKVARK
jgi:hypothetical protein